MLRPKPRDPILDDEAATLDLLIDTQTEIVNRLGREIIDTAERLLRRVDSSESFEEALVGHAAYLPELRTLMSSYRTSENTLRHNIKRREQRNKTPGESILSGVRSDETGYPAMGDQGNA